MNSRVILENTIKTRKTLNPQPSFSGKMYNGLAKFVSQTLLY